MSRRALVMAALGFFVCACGGPAERSGVVTAFVTEQVPSRYQALQAAAADLGGVLASACDSAPDDVPEALDALRQARSAWKHAESVWIGPVMERRSWARIDWPVDVEAVDALLVAPEPATVTAEHLSTKVAAGQRGLGAIEVLLARDPSALDGGSADRRCDYLVAAAQVIEAEADVLAAAWTTGIDGDDPAPSALAADADQAVDDAVNDLLGLLERMTSMELAPALGIDRSEPDPGAVVEGPAGLGVADAVARIEGVRAVLLGPDGLEPLLASDLRGRIEAELDRSEAAARAVEAPLRQALTADRPDVEALLGALEDLRRIVATEVVAELGVTVGFGDGDGDGG